MESGHGDDRIALFMPLLVGGGAERVMINLASAIASEGVAVDLVVVRAEGVLLEEVRALPGVQLVPLGGRKASTSLVGLARYLRRVRPFGIVSAMNTPNITCILAARLARYRGAVIATVHNTPSREYANPRTLLGRVTPTLMRMIYPLADDVVTVSEGVADDLSASIGVPRDSLRVIYNPVVSPRLFEAAVAEPNDPSLVGDDVPTFVGIGRLAKQKDFGTLIRAFRLVRAKRRCRLVILGEGPARGELEQLVSELGLEEDVVLPGFVANPYAILARAQTFVLSSRWEGLPTVLIEALALGIPIVATDCRSGPSEILANGRYGSLTPVGDVAAMAVAMAERLDQQRDAAQGMELAQPYLLRTAARAYLQLARGQRQPSER